MPSVQILTFHRVRSTVCIPDRSQALDKVAELIEHSEAAIYTDASEKHSRLGAAVVMVSRKVGPQRTWQIGIGPASD
jgi:hypothetical protein